MRSGRNYAYRTILVIILLVSVVCLGSSLQRERAALAQGDAGGSGLSAILGYGTTAEDAKFAQIEQIYDQLLRDYYLELDPEVLAEGAIRGMLDAVDDPYTFYYSKEEWSDMLEDSEGVYAGIGIQVLAGDDLDYLLITRCFRDSPADQAGVKCGDKIVRVDGFTVGMATGGNAYLYAATEEEAAKYPVVEDIPTNYNDLISYMRGVEGSTVLLTVERDGELLDLVLTRAVISMNRTDTAILEDDAGNRIGYLAIYEFQGDADEGVAEAVKYFEENNCDGMVIDLRNNPGGELNTVTNIVDSVLPSGLFCYIEDSHGYRQNFYSDGEYWGKPLAVLVNGYSASASELFTGATKDLDAGVIVGTTSFGKGIVQSLFELPDGSGFQFTVARYFTPSGHIIQGNGIEPDLWIEPDGNTDTSMIGYLLAQGTADWRSDNQIAAAVDAVSRWIADGVKPEYPGKPAEADMEEAAPAA